jgi:hypothetical protein
VGHNGISALAAVSDFASAASRPENRGLSGCSQLNLIKGISKPDRHSADKGSADSSGQSHQGKACLIGIQLSGKLWMGA